MIHDYDTSRDSSEMFRFRIRNGPFAQYFLSFGGTSRQLTSKKKTLKIDIPFKPVENCF